MNRIANWYFVGLMGLFIVGTAVEVLSVPILIVCAIVGKQCLP